jgi:hypothetical protein
MGASGGGGAVGGGNYVEDVFSTYLYTGNDSTQTITNGIDLAGEGGLVWIKGRSGSTGHRLTDTARGATKSLESNSAGIEAAESTGLTSFSSTGFALGADADYSTNAATYASWTFRKAEKFFDIVTYTGNGANRTIAHNLGSVPGCIIVKRTDAATDWQVYHRILANTEYLVLNSTAAKTTGTTRWNSTTPTNTVFNLGTDTTVNASGGTYVAYVFAHDPGGVIQCGSFTKTASHPNDPPVILGWEPQWIMFKRVDSSGEDWIIGDTMSGAGTNTGVGLSANNSNAESSTLPFTPLSTGFSIGNSSSVGATYIYIAIRRGPMKTPTDATKVFDLDAYTTNNSGSQVISVGFPADMVLARERTTTGNLSSQWPLGTRLLGNGFLRTTLTNALATFLDMVNGWDDQNSIDLAGIMVGNGTIAEILYSFRRAPGFFDIVTYTGTGSNRTVSHNLGVVPELMIVKKRSAADNWVVYAGDATDYLILNTTAATADLDTMWNDTAPTNAVFSLGTNDDVNGNTATFIAYLFATCPGISKVGSYTGTGTTLNIDCGFTAGARFVLIKRTDSTGDWYVWDTARGIGSGNDPYLLLNSTAVEDTSTDYIDPLSSGFQISSSAPAAINANGGSFIYLAIA